MIVIHELGHYTFAKIFGISVDKIYIYPLGGIAKFNMPLNTCISNEFVILIAGPLFQIIASLVLCILFPYDKKLILMYNSGILFFNLLPIYPLDGGKLINLLLNNFFPYKLCLKLSIYTSYVILLIIFILSNININLVVMITLSLILLTKERRKISQLHNKFILERYLNNFNFIRSILVHDENEFYKNRRHLINKNGSYYLENEYLEKKYQKITKKR